jgi:DNA helicase-2/ATP-dependent DNA helicase PcrA
MRSVQKETAKPSPSKYRGTDNNKVPSFSTNSFTKNNLKPVFKKPVSKPVSAQALENFIPDDPQLIQVGMEVLHQRFGQGKVVGMEGKLPDLKATVEFENEGPKQLLLKYARLKIVGTGG